jgi:hypothetical protein
MGPGKLRGLDGVIRALRPTVLIGASGQSGAFNRSAVELMAAQARRPVILPLSNPTACSEAVPEDLMRPEKESVPPPAGSGDDVATQGRAAGGGGSFDRVTEDPAGSARSHDEAGNSSTGRLHTMRIHCWML